MRNPFIYYQSGKESGSAATHGGGGGKHGCVCSCVLGGWEVRLLAGGEGEHGGLHASLAVYMQVWLSKRKSDCLHASLAVYIYMQVWLSTRKSGCLHVRLP